MTRKTTLVLTALALLVPGAAVRATVTGAPSQPAAAAELQRLQGTWEGVLVGQESAGKITITFAGNSLHFQGLRTEEWYDATFTLQEGTRPQRLRATITGCERETDIGTEIGAYFKIVDGTLSLAGIEDDAQEPRNSFLDGKPLFGIEDGSVGVCAPSPDGPEVFEGNSMFHYRFRKVKP
jgi:hypothetical protein